MSTPPRASETVTGPLYASRGKKGRDRNGRITILPPRVMRLGESELAEAVELLAYLFVEVLREAGAPEERDHEEEQVTTD